jgi:putative restriction endonuclease
MPKRKVDQYERAKRAWAILVECAKNRKIITYGELAAKMGLHPRVCRFFLGPIQDHCLEHNLPLLQVLGVHTKTRLPGVGFRGALLDRDHIAAAQEKVFEADWERIRNPF